MKEVKDIIADFDPISLKEMDNVKLLNRTDTKYVIQVGMLPEILGKVKHDYYILTIEEKRLFSYETLYFDTDDSKMFTAHHNGKLNRYKIRKRNYTDSELHYLEIKFKNNKGRTIKERILNEKFDPFLSNQEKDFIREKCPYVPDNLEEKIYTFFKRFTLVNRSKQERVTIDTDLYFKSDKIIRKVGHICIIEVKQNKFNKESTLVETLKEKKILSSSFSKYCVGTALLNEASKINNFKPKILKIKNLKHA